MASITEERLKEMEEEMNRFEEEISSVRPPVMPAGRGGGRGGHNSKVIIGANTFHEVAAKLTHPDEGFHDPHQMAPFQGGPLPPPPPPPSMSDYMGPAPGMAGPMRPPPPPPLHSGGPPSHHPPPPQRHPAFVPPQIRHHRPPMNRPPMNRPPMNRVPPPFHEQHMGRGGGGPPMMRPPPPPRGLHPPMRPQGPFMGPSQGPPRPINPAIIQKPPVVVEKPKIVYSAAPVRNVPKEEVKPKVVEPEVVTPVPPPVAVVAPPVQPTVPMETMQTKPLPPVSLNPDRCAYVVPGMSMETEAEAAKREKKEKKKKFTRTAAGTSWEDNTLGEWEQDDFRIFCGDIGNEVTEECLARAFSRYPSFLKSRVVRDKRTNKTRGYGFVSFKDPNDFVRAMREMNGKYVGNRPIKLRKSSWKDRQFEVVKKKDKEKKKLGFR